MPFDFPSTGLVIGQTATAPTGAVYVWDGVAWRPMSVPLPPYAPLTSPVFQGDPQVPLAPYGDADQSIASTQFVTRAVVPAYDNVGRNLIHNPLMAIAQRGVGPFTALPTYTLDRWRSNGVTDTVSWIQAPVGDTERAAIGDEAAQGCIQNTFTGNAAAGAYNELDQAIEKVSRLGGKTVTFSFYAVANAALRLGINATQSFGTGGSPSAAVNVLTTGIAVTLSTTWMRYTATIAMPSIAGKTLGTNGDDWTQIRIGLSSGANANAFFGNIGVQSGVVKLWGIQLEIGSVATPLEKPDPMQDIAKCQRFYQPFYQALVSGYGGVSGAIFLDLSLGVAMRANPTVTFANITSSNASGLAMNSSQFNHVKLQSSITAAGSGYQQADIIISADL